MPTVTILDPNSTISITGAVVVGAGDADDALRDHDDDDWVEFQDADTVVLALDDSPTIAADERISSLKVKVKGATVGSGLTSFIADFIDATSDTTAPSISRSQSLPQYTQVNGSEILVDPDDAEWTETVVDGIRLRLRSTAFQTSQLRAIWANVEVKVHAKANMLQIAATKRSLAPLLQWSGIDNGDPQAAFRMKIFTEAVYTGGGFDPETSTAVYDSGDKIYGGTNAHQVPAGLLSYGTNYVWAAKAASVFPGGVTPGETWWGNWTFSPFATTSLPVISSISVSATDSSMPTIEWDYDDADLKVADSFDVKVFRSDDVIANGGNYSITTPIYSVTLPGGASGGTYDHELTQSLLNATSYAATITAHTSTPFATDPWDDIGWTTGWDPPGVPTLRAIPDPDNARVRLQVQGHDNMLTEQESSFETGVASWGSLSNATLTSVTAQADHETHSGELSSLAAGHMSTTTPTGLSAMPVLGGRQYSLYAKSRANTVARTVEAVISFYTAAGAAAGLSLVAQQVDSTSAWTVHNATVTAPDNAAFVGMELYVRSTGGASEEHYFDRLAVMPGETAAWVVGGHDSTIRVERSVDGGVTWQAVRGAEALVTDAAQFKELYDNEAPAHKTVQYRAIAVSTAFGSPQSSDYSAITSVELDMVYSFLKNPLDESLNMHVVSEDRVLTRLHSRRMGLYEPLGRSNPVIMTGSVRAESYSILVMTRTEAEEEKLRELLESDQVLIHHTPRKLRYVKISGDIQEGEFLWSALHEDSLVDSHWSIPLVEVDAP